MTFPIQWYLYPIIGLVMGTLSGALGVGSAIVLIPILTLILGFAQKTAQGISLFVMVPMTLMAAIRYYGNPQISINLWVVLLLAIAAVAGANIGSSIAFYLPADILKKVFAVFIILVGILMLIK